MRCKPRLTKNVYTYIPSLQIKGEGVMVTFNNVSKVQYHMPLFCLVLYRIKILNHARLTKTLFVDKQMSRCMQLKTSRY